VTGRRLEAVSETLDSERAIYTWPMERSTETTDARLDSEVQRISVDALLEAALVEGDAAGAVARFERVLAVEPRHPEARHGLVRALEDAGRGDDALRVTEQLIAEEPEDVLAVTRLSMLYQHKGMIAEAEAAAARAKILGWKQELRSGVAPKTTL
jgi:DNA-binding SARP family transcriptional activator